MTKLIVVYTLKVIDLYNYDTHTHDYMAIAFSSILSERMEEWICAAFSLNDAAAMIKIKLKVVFVSAAKLFVLCAYTTLATSVV